jgi:hypothetical protein
MTTPLTVWYRGNLAKSWSPSSYVRLHDIYDAESFWRFFNNLPPLDGGLMCIMRGDAGPYWEHPSNRGGGAWTMMITGGNDPAPVLVDLAAKLYTNTLPPCVTGVTICPRADNYSIKIWANRHAAYDNSIPANPASYKPFGK